jgi:CRISPR-associated endonuclease/helicase Cas3
VEQRVSVLAPKLGVPLLTYLLKGLAGVHDLGKWLEFQEYIRKEDRRRGECKHADVGAWLFLKHSSASSLARLLATLSSQHHGALPNSDELLNPYLEPPEVAGRVQQALQRSGRALLPLPELVLPDQTAEDKRRAELLLRLAYSVLIDSDCLDAEMFYSGRKAELRAHYPSLFTLLIRLNATLARGFPAPISPVLRACRQEFSDICAAQALGPPDFYSLAGVTGIGKTLASMRFGLSHALVNKQARVIVVMPTITITSQTAQEYKSIFGADAVCEHHSNLDQDKASEVSTLACTNWDAPIIVTTMVQFMESLGSNQRSRCRKLHNLVDALIIIDEAQLLPVTVEQGKQVISLLPTCLDFLRQLVQYYHCTVVLSTATQPALQERYGSKAGLHGGLPAVRPIISVEKQQEYQRKLVRVSAAMPKVLPDGCWQETPWAEIIPEFSTHPTGLMIVNYRAQASMVAEALQQTRGDCFHLSRNMTYEHCDQVIATVKQQLARGDRITGCSTSLVETGVNFGFPVVYRALAGVDTLCQAAGRCNRDGLLALGYMKVFVPQDAVPDTHMRRVYGIMRCLLQKYGTLDIFNAELQREYFSMLYRYELPGKDVVDESRQALNYADTADQFKIIADYRVTVVFCRDDHAKALVRAFTQRVDSDSWRLRQKLQPYMVGVSERDRAWLLDHQVAKEASGLLYVLDPTPVYHPIFGFTSQAKPSGGKGRAA